MLELKNISYTVEGEKDIINDVSLKIEDGKFIVITGPNGSGKSTLAKIISILTNTVNLLALFAFICILF